MGGGRREAFLVGKKEESLPSDSCLSEPFLGFLNFSVVFDTVTQTASRPLSFLVERYRFSVISIPYTAQGRKPSPRRRVWPCCCVCPAWSVVSNGKTAQLGNCWCIGGMLGVAVTAAPAVRRRALTWQSASACSSSQPHFAPSGGCALRPVRRGVICSGIASGDGYESAACVGIG